NNSGTAMSSSRILQGQGRMLCRDRSIRSLEKDLPWLPNRVTATVHDVVGGTNATAGPALDDGTLPAGAASVSARVQPPRTRPILINKEPITVTRNGEQRAGILAGSAIGIVLAGSALLGLAPNAHAGQG